MVDGIKHAVTRLFDVPKELICKVVFDQSVFVKTAIETLLHEGAIGLFLTSVMILVFLGSMRATMAVFFSIPLSALAAFIALSLGGSSINSMVLGGLALAFSRLIDNSVVVLENIYRHLELGEPPEMAAEKGGREVALPVLASTLTTMVVFFPVTFLYGVSKFLFSRTGARRRPLPLGLVCRRHDRCAPLLRPLHQGSRAPRHARFGSPGCGGAPQGARHLRGTLQCLVQ